MLLLLDVLLLVEAVQLSADRGHPPGRLGGSAGVSKVVPVGQHQVVAARGGGGGHGVAGGAGGDVGQAGVAGGGVVLVVVASLLLRLVEVGAGAKRVLVLEVLVLVLLLLLLVVRLLGRWQLVLVMSAEELVLAVHQGQLAGQPCRFERRGSVSGDPNPLYSHLMTKGAGTRGRRQRSLAFKRRRVNNEPN